jgi:hypothetical protein
MKWGIGAAGFFVPKQFTAKTGVFPRVGVT